MLIPAGLVLLAVVGVAVALVLRPSDADEFRQLYDDTRAIFVERGDEVPPFFDPEWMDVSFAWDGDRAEVHANNVEPRHAEYDPGYEAYRICEWASSWVRDTGGPAADLAVYVDGDLVLVRHDDEECVSADAD